jgi:ligand-binding sensor domain-containing protein
MVYQASADNTRYTFRQLKVEDGLSQSTILTILQDKKGYMWFGTGNGLNKYNGYSFVIYSNIINEPSSISSNAITSLFEDSRGTLWIGTVDGVLNRFNRETETFTRFNITSGLDKIRGPEEEYYDYPVSFARNNNNSLTTISEDKKGRLWIGTWGKGLIMFDPVNGETEHYYKGKDGTNSLSHNRITKIICDSFGTMWIGTMGGLNLLRVDDGDAVFISKNSNKAVIDEQVMSLLEDKKKNVWVGTYNSGLFRTEREVTADLNTISFIRYSHYHVKNSISSNTVMTLLQDQQGYIWAGTFGGGLDRINSETGEFLNFKKNRFDENSIADDDVLAMYEDRSGIIWIGTHLGSGISKLEKNKIKFNHLRNTTSQNSLKR